MSVKYDKDGTIETFNGDTFKMRIGNIPKDKNYRIYWEVKNKNNETIFAKMEESNNEDYVVFEITKEDTELLEVPINKTKEVYYHALKYCYDNSEHTATVKNTVYGSRYKLVVNSKRAEGDIDVQP